jgi:hypothetical protein
MTEMQEAKVMSMSEAPEQYDAAPLFPNVR